MRLVPAALVAALITSPASAAVLVVPDTFGTIGAALSASVAGDTVLVRAGTYPEHLTLVDGVVLLADDPLDRPVIDGSGTGRVLVATNCGAGTEVNAFVIRGGFSTGLGGGVSLAGSAVSFTGCDFRDNTAMIGGAIGATGSPFTVDACAFSGNVATQSGGAIGMTDASAPLVQNSTFVGNHAFAGGAIVIRNGCTPQITGCLVDGGSADQGAALWYDFLTGGSLTQCTIVNATATGANGGILYLASLATPAVERNILAFNTGGGAVFAVGGAAATFDCNCVFGNAGGDSLLGGTVLDTNLAVDPRFCTAYSGGDYSLMDISPCANDAVCPLIGAFPVGCTATVGAPEVPQDTWGHIKSRWR